MRFYPRFISSRAVFRQAFTLIELLVVISIIAVLAGLLLPVGQKVIENSKKVSAKSTMLQIVAAVKNFQSEYGVYPVAPSTTTTTPADTTYDDTSSAAGGGSGGQNVVLMDVLRARNTTDVNSNADPSATTLNPRRIVYFEYKDAKNPTAPIDGFVPVPAAGAGTSPKDATGAVTLKPGDLMDNWGNLYRIRVDSGYSDKVVDPFSTTSSPTADDTSSSAPDQNTVHTGVIAWSIGSTHVAYNPTAGPGTTFLTSGNVATWK